MMKPLLSIVVPTKDRYTYLKPLIELIKSFDSEEIEVVVQDNTKDNTEIVEYIGQLNYQQVKYFHTAEQVSVAYNCDLGILNSTGEYVCLLGDDDGVCAHVVAAVQWMKKNEIDVLRSTMISYKWPSFNFSKIGNFSAVLMMGIYDKSYRKLDAISELKKCLHEGANSRHGITFLPKVYHAISKRSTLNKVYDVGGTYFPGASPDMANSVAMSFVVENFVYLDFPIVIPGNSVHTGGDSKKYKGQRAPISEIAFLPKDTEKKWELFIPKIWASHTIMPETACKALKYMGKSEFIDQYLDKEKMLANFVVAQKDLKDDAFEISQNKIRLSFLIILFLFNKVLSAIFNKLSLMLYSVLYDGGSNAGWIFNRKNYFRIVRNLNSINEANAYLMEKEKQFYVK